MAKVDMPMPQMGESITEGTIIKWLKKEGERVERDEIIVEISTDKVDSEIPAPFSGVLHKILAAEDATIQVGSAIASIETEEDQQSTAAPEIPATEASSLSGPKEAAGSTAATVVATATSPEISNTARGTGLVDIVMPQMGESITEGTVIKWLKNKGDSIERDEILLEISTDKVDSEIPSTHAGVLQEILAAEGEVVEVGAVIARMASQDGAQVEVDSPAAAPAETVTAGPRPQSPPPETQRMAVVPAKPAQNGSERKFYSPLVRSIAKSEGISHEELNMISGTGAHGRVTKKDVLNYLDSRPGQAKGPVVVAQAPVPTSPSVRAEPTSADDRVEIIPMNAMRKSIARHMVASVQTSPHVFMMTEADMTDLVTYRTRNKDAFLQRTGTKLTYMPFIVNASVKALQDYPLVNSSLDGDRIIQKKYINIGIAVALQNSGLIVPVIKNADGLSVVGLARAINDLAGRARIKKLQPDEVQDGTFSITNMGSFGSLLGFPIINQPQVAILGIGTIQKRPVVIDDAIAIRSMIYVTLSFDHRLVDGALAGQFLEQVATYLTNFDIDSIM